MFNHLVVCLLVEAAEVTSDEDAVQQVDDVGAGVTCSETYTVVTSVTVTFTVVVTVL